MHEDFGKKIVIYGAGFEAERFLCHRKDEFDVEFYIDRIANRTFHGKQVYAIEEVPEDIQHKKILVATSEAGYYEISKILDGKGLIEYQDYMSIYDYGKKLLVLYGNCHMIMISKYLQQQIEFIKKYHVKMFYVGEKKAPSANDLKYCDVFIGQDIRKDNELGMPDISSLMEMATKCQKIIIPNLYGYNFFWPQVTGRFDNTDNWHIGDDRMPESDMKNLSYNARGPVKWMIGWHDKYIEAELEKGTSIDEIYENCIAGDIFQPENVKKSFLEAIESLIEREKACDIKISDYILENYRDKDLFYDPGHPTNILIREFVRRILNKLNYNDSEFDDCEFRLDSSEIFIYGCVRKALGIKYDKKYLKHFETRGTLWNRPISVKEYIKQYKLWFENK